MSVSMSVENLEKRFGEAHALRGVSLTVARGELVALLGPSGSGKTTLLRVIAGLESVEAGRVLFDGADAAALSLRDRRIGFVFQHYALFRHLTVLENVAFGLRARPRRERPGEAEIRARALALLDLVQLGGYERRFPSQLSGGQRQRVALARALAIEPRVLLLDEPFGALDAKVRKDLRRWLRDLHARTGHTTLFVTHDQDEALELADRVAILNEGRIEQVGSPDEVYDAPATAFVCAFLGEANRIPIAVTGATAYVQGCAVLSGLDNAPDGDATLFVRPHHLRLEAQGAGGLSGRVVGVRRNGPQRRLDVLIEGLTTPLEIDAASDVAPPPGAQVAVRVLRGRAFLL